MSVWQGSANSTAAIVTDFTSEDYNFERLEYRFF
jgi:hypothetical protein